MPFSRLPTLSIAGQQVHLFLDPSFACGFAAEIITTIIHEANEKRGRAVLGLATGGTPIRVYERLVAKRRSGEISFRQVHTFNLDEYYPIAPLDPKSYRAYMHQHLFSHVDLPANQAHVLDGTVPDAFVEAHCAEYERWIEHVGGLDMQLLGIGRNGHIGFNEPSDLGLEAAMTLPTRRTPLHPVTVADAARDFGGDPAAVPKTALTMGTRAILSARKVLILAFGAAKAPAVAAALQGPINTQLPASFLRTLPGRVIWVLDEAAASGLDPS